MGCKQDRFGFRLSGTGLHIFFVDFWGEPNPITSIPVVIPISVALFVIDQRGMGKAPPTPGDVGGLAFHPAIIRHREISVLRRRLR
jgi:hypothetical protein